MISFSVRVLLATVALALTFMLGGGVLVAVFGDIGIPLPETNPLPWQIVSWVIIAATLMWVAMRSHLSGWRLAACLGILYFGISHFNSIIEARFFGLFTSRQFWGILMASALSDALFVLALIPIVRGLEPRTAALDWRVRFSPLRVAVGAVAYVVFYFIAGIMVIPFVIAFYEQMGALPKQLHVVAMQLLIRGPVFVALAALLVRMSGTSRRETIVMVGGALTLLGGVATLIVPNSFIPDGPRWAHFVEVTISNFLYGCFLGWLLTSHRAPSEAAAQAPPVAAGAGA